MIIVCVVAVTYALGKPALLRAFVRDWELRATIDWSRSTISACRATPPSAAGFLRVTSTLASNTSDGVLATISAAVWPRAVGRLAAKSVEKEELPPPADAA